jgi:N-methylhydantoinase A
LHEEGIDPARIEHRIHLDLRYVKQYHEVTVPVSAELIERGDTRAIAEAFHREHDRLYGYELSAEGTELELINLRVRAIGATYKPGIPRIDRGGEDSSAARKGVRRAFVPETSAFADMPVFDGHSLTAGNTLEGPALIERTDTTIFVSDAFRARIDDHGSCLLTRKES